MESWEKTVLPLEYSVFDGLHCTGISDKEILIALNAQAKASYEAGVKTVVEAITPQLELRDNAYPNDKTWWYYTLDYEYWQSFLKQHGMSNK